MNSAQERLSRTLRALACALSACAVPTVAGSAAEDQQPRTPKLRVLYIEGSARWEYRYLKNALLRDPSVAAQCYLTTAPREFKQESSPGLPPLTALPKGPEGFAVYDVVVLGALPKESLREHGATLGKDLTELVKVRGRGLVVLAGPDFRAAQELAEVLPVLLPEKRPGQDSRDSREPFRVRLTEKGGEAGFLRLDEDPAASRRLWEEELPAFHSCLEGALPKPQAEILAVRAAKEPRGSPAAVVVELKFGEGRSLFLGIDELWRWRAGVDDLYFYRFWKQALHHVAGKRSSPPRGGSEGGDRR